MELFQFLFVRPNLCSILGPNHIEGFMVGGLASLIEGHWLIFILILFVIGFNPYNVYALLYGTPTYGEIYIFTHLGYWIGALYGSTYFVVFIFIVFAQ